MKKTIKLYAIGNEGNFNYYIFDKKQDVAKKLSKILNDSLKVTWGFTNFEGDVPKQINIEKYVDSHATLISWDNKSRVDVFYANKKMFVIIHCSEKLRLKFNEELFKITQMPKPSRAKFKSRKNKK